jgi:hydrogenase nickel incorporation protein HypA/HybF
LISTGATVFTAVHELSLMRTLLQQVDEHQASHPSCHLCRIEVSVGEFSGVDPELLRLAFGDATCGTPLEEVAFAVSRVPLSARCRSCDCEFRVKWFPFL